jgi:hypothetical protein
MDVHLLLNMWVSLKKWYPKIPVACYHCQNENAISSWYSGWWLSHPSEKWWTSSVGMMKFPLNMESHSKFHGSVYHQPDIIYYIYTVSYTIVIIVSYTIVMFQSPPTSHKFAGIFEDTSSHPARLAPHRRTQIRWDSEPPQSEEAPLVASWVPWKP